MESLSAFQCAMSKCVVVDKGTLKKFCSLVGPKHVQYPVRNAPPNGVLLHASLGLYPTVFGSEPIAQAAISRTHTWQEGQGFSCSEFEIISEGQYAAIVEEQARKFIKGKRKKKHT